MSSDLLARILADKKARLDRGEYAVSPDAPREGAPDRESFLASLKAPGVRIIAEIKSRSPSAGELLAGADGKVETFALAYRRGHAAAISVVTEEDHFGGKPEWLARAKRISGLPVLMKDFFLSEPQLDFAVCLGADAVLLIVRALEGPLLETLSRAARDRGLAVVAEAHGSEEIARAAACQPDVLGVNARDLSTFETDLDLLARLAREIPEGPVKLAESGIKTRADIARLSQAGYGAFLVGEALLVSDDPEETLRELKK